MIHTDCVSKKAFNANYKAFSKFFRSLNSTLKMKLILNSRKLYIYAPVSKKPSDSFTLMKGRPFEYVISSKLTLKITTSLTVQGVEYSDNKTATLLVYSISLLLIHGWRIRKSYLERLIEESFNSLRQASD